MIYGNYFQKDCDDLPSVHDHGLENIWYQNNSGNTWSGWEWEDMDKNGVGDKPFEINGSAGSKDMYPRSDLILISEEPTGEEDKVGYPDRSENLLTIFIATIITISLLIIMILIRGRKTGNQ
jgi:hypothetical protein